MNIKCFGEHHFFVAETGTVESEGKVCVIIVCTSCGESKLIEHFVAGPRQKGQTWPVDKQPIQPAPVAFSTPGVKPVPHS